MTDAYAASGVDTSAADRGVAALVGILRSIDTGKASRAVPLPGHFAAVLEVAPNLGIAVGTDASAPSCSSPRRPAAWTPSASTAWR